MPIGKFWGKFMPSAEKKYSVGNTFPGVLDPSRN